MTMGKWSDLANGITTNDEEQRGKVLAKIKEAALKAVGVSETSNLRFVVIMDEDGDVYNTERDYNSWCEKEHKGTAVCIASFRGGQFETQEDVAEYMAQYADDYLDEELNLLDARFED
jgi:hypothetical protein